MFGACALLFVYLSTPVAGSHAQCSEFIVSGRSCGLLSLVRSGSRISFVGCSRSAEVQPTSKVSEL